MANMFFYAVSFHFCFGGTLLKKISIKNKALQQ